MSLNVDNILIIGLGMIGSSIALASKSKGINVTGFDLDDETLKKAINENQHLTKMRIVDGFLKQIYGYFLLASVKAVSSRLLLKVNSNARNP